MEAKHTPGPWSCLSPSLSGHTTIRGPSGCDVAAVAYRSEANFTVRFGGDLPDPEADANARLIAAAPDHALIAWAMCVQDGTWEEWDGQGRGEFCFAGLRHATRLDEFGAPILTDNLRAILTEERRTSAAFSKATTHTGEG
jgi:hypothetical protein